ncbi:hypothetical protein B0H16DRAFT_1478107 [Mycena metata]|uniref:Secreted protein n=1 Tax=Mycena metata TaxID=1033252 RepID=A0AAD7H809_9AGAR|nr:hypothetical protein B0H16DRAFT_1478107 [Mycena metata]
MPNATNLVFLLLAALVVRILTLAIRARPFCSAEDAAGKAWVSGVVVGRRVVRGAGRVAVFCEGRCKRDRNDNGVQKTHYGTKTSQLSQAMLEAPDDDDEAGGGSFFRAAKKRLRVSRSMETHSAGRCVGVQRRVERMKGEKDGTRTEEEAVYEAASISTPYA